MCAASPFSRVPTSYFPRYRQVPRVEVGRVPEGGCACSRGGWARESAARPPRRQRNGPSQGAGSVPSSGQHMRPLRGPFTLLLLTSADGNAPLAAFFPTRRQNFSSSHTSGAFGRASGVPERARLSTPTGNSPAAAARARAAAPRLRRPPTASAQGRSCTGPRQHSPSTLHCWHVTLRCIHLRRASPAAPQLPISFIPKPPFPAGHV